MNRRYFLQALGLGASAFAFLAAPIRGFASWKSGAFDAEELKNSLQEIYGDSELIESSSINFKAPEIAENGAAVPISVSSDLPNVESIAVFALANPRPLLAYFSMSPRSVADVSTRVKMGETGDVVAVVRSDGKNYAVTREVKVTIGGCGG